MATAARKSGGAASKSAKGTTRRTTRNTPSLSKDEEFQAYRDMLLIRRFEEKSGQMYGMGLIGGFCHLYIGQEAVVVGMQMASKDGESGDHGIPGVTGTCSPRAWTRKGVLAELTGRKGGVFQGEGRLDAHVLQGKKSTSMAAMASSARKVPLGTGIAFASRYRGEDSVCLTYFGDGAANQGQVYESFTMAALWKLPVVYVIENNRYAMGTSVSRAAAQTDFSRRRALLQHSRRAGRRHGYPRREGSGRARHRACPFRRGPFILEMLTYRYRGHSMSDPAKYRTKDEVTRMREEQDPIEQVRRRLLGEWEVPEKDLKEVDSGDPQDRQRGGRFRDQPIPSPIRRSSGPTSCTDSRFQPVALATARAQRRASSPCPSNVLMPALSPTMEPGQTGQMA